MKQLLKRIESLKAISKISLNQAREKEQLKQRETTALTGESLLLCTHG